MDCLLGPAMLVIMMYGMLIQQVLEVVNQLCKPLILQASCNCMQCTVDCCFVIP